ncbi:hypothetical protein BJX96DRAFT_144338 [Aspergillus floccosus]
MNSIFINSVSSTEALLPSSSPHHHNTPYQIHHTSLPVSRILLDEMIVAGPAAKIDGRSCRLCASGVAPLRASPRRQTLYASYSETSPLASSPLARTVSSPVGGCSLFVCQPMEGSVLGPWIRHLCNIRFPPRYGT